MQTKTYRLARTFCEDHWDRGCGETDKVLREMKRIVEVELDIDGFRDMLSDADYYWDLRTEMGGDELCRSAKCVLDALEKAGPPEGYAIERRGFSVRVVEVAA